MKADLQGEMIGIKGAAESLGVNINELAEAVTERKPLRGVTLPVPLRVGTMNKQFLFYEQEILSAAKVMQQQARYPIGTVVISRKDELDDDEHGEERITPAGSEWTVTGHEDDGSCHIVCAATGGWIVPCLHVMDSDFFPK
ncbi:hypothetical protein [Halomonas sp. 3A7M]|uniref:hypothetical protein n=1 Tax=Halomonas sp. 3A7M TaxID=2742616 RepID=UPI0018675135|nr:hypothetical protein [Halomonas sp. 3A7M]